MLNNPLDRHLYPGAVWSDRESTVCIIQSSLTHVTIMEVGTTTAAEVIPVESFMGVYTPVLADDEPVVEYGAPQLPSDKLVAEYGAASPNPALFNFSLKVVKLLAEYKPKWYADPSATSDMLRLAVETAVTNELHLTGKTGNILAVLLENLTQVYDESCRAAAHLTKDLENLRLSGKAPK